MDILGRSIVHPFQLAAWNTVKRRDGGLPPDYWDMCKFRHTYFMALTKAFANADNTRPED